MIDEKFIGEGTRKRMRESEYFALAYFIAELRYNASEDGNNQIKFPSKIYMGENKIPKMAQDNMKFKYADTMKMLAEIQLLLEGLALKSVT